MRDRAASGRSSVTSSLSHRGTATATAISVQRINAEGFRVRQLGGKAQHSVACAPNASAVPPQRGQGAEMTATTQRGFQNLNDRQGGPSLEIAFQRSSTLYIYSPTNTSTSTPTTTRTTTQASGSRPCSLHLFRPLD